MILFAKPKIVQFFSIFLSALILISASSVMAVELFPEEVCVGNASDSSVCRDAGNDGANDNPLYGPNGIMTVAINLVSLIIGIAAVIVIILAGLKYITSGSNPQEVTKAREMVLYAIVGLIIAALAQALVRFILSKL